MSALNLGGYLIAFLAVCLYNYRKLQEMTKDKPTAAPPAAEPAVRPEAVPLLRPGLRRGAHDDNISTSLQRVASFSDQRPKRGQS